MTEKIDFTKSIAALREHIRTPEVYNNHQVFDITDLRNATDVFFHVASNMAFDFYTRNHIPLDAAGDQNELFGSMVREMLIQHTGIDLAETRSDILGETTIEIAACISGEEGL